MIINNTTLIIFTFCTVFYSRIFCTITHAPSILNHIHFVFVPLAFLVTLTTSFIKDFHQLKIIFSFLVGLFFLLVVIIASSFWNDAGFINSIGSFMMLGEPFLFLVAIICIPMSTKSIQRIKKWFLGSALINFLLAAIQKQLIDAGKLDAGGFTGTDGCGGVFYISGAGNYVSASVSVAFALYLFADKKNFSLRFRIGAIIAACWQVLFSDSKQLVFAYTGAWMLLILINSKNLSKTITFFLTFLLFSFVFVWCVENIEALAPFGIWKRPELVSLDGPAGYTKFYSVRSILSHYQSPMNWLFGLGPGHTVSRLGAWFIKDYWNILGPLGATQHPISQEAIDFIHDFWLAYSSSLYSPLFGWAGIWGDLGLMGLGTYLFLDYLVWQHFGLNDFLKINLLCVLMLGFIFTQMEEPGYMLSIAAIMGLAWQEKQLINQTEPIFKQKENEVKFS